MIYSADFVEMAGKINHVNVSKYLRALGWIVVPTKRKHVEVFQLNENGAFFQADLPTSTELRDYKIAMYRTVESIASSLNKNIEQVILELLNPLSDVVKLRVKEPELETGNIFFEDAIKLYDNAKKLIWAAAKDISSPKLSHGGRADRAIEEFVANCRFGQTEIGSYVISVVCPIFAISDNQYTQLSLFNKEEEAANSITRNVVNKLITSVRKVKESIHQGNFEGFIRENAETSNCISINFLEALSEISIYRKNSSLDIDVQYASTVQENRLDDTFVSIDHNYYSPINTFVSSSKVIQERSKSFIGRSKRLKATPNIETRDGGSIFIVFLDEKGNKETASIDLTKEDYVAAIEAHKAGKNVRVVGVLSGKKSNKKIKYSSFEVLD